MAGPPRHDWGRNLWIALHRVKQTMTMPGRRARSVFGVIFAGFRVLAQFPDAAVVAAVGLHPNGLLFAQFHKAFHGKSGCGNGGQNGKGLSKHGFSSPEG